MCVCMSERAVMCCSVFGVCVCVCVCVRESVSTGNTARGSCRHGFHLKLRVKDMNDYTYKYLV